MNHLSLDNLTFSDYEILWMFFIIIISGFISYCSFPVIIKISKLKGLIQEPSDRSSHSIGTPNLGGVGIFLGIVSALTLIGSILSYNNLLCLIGATLLLFFTGLKDDLIEITPFNKITGQIIASLCVILISDIRIYSFFGILGIETLPYLVSVIFTLFVFILLINSINLIDGVDGLAGCIGLTISSFFGIFFYFNENYSILFISLSLIGALTAFLRFNFSKSKKLFMGDTGSMIIGFLLAYQGISFLRIEHNIELFSFISNPPALVIAIFSFPLMDTLRVFTIRITKGRSPFLADKNHIHHNLISLGFKHWQISVMASIFLSIMTILTYWFNQKNIYELILLLVTISGIFSTIPYFILKNKQYVKKLTVKDFIKTRPSYTIELKRIYNSILNIFISIIIYLSM